MSRIALGVSPSARDTNPRLNFAMKAVPQGIAADLMATLAGHTRVDVDRFAVESHRRAARAQAEGRFARSLVPVRDINGLVILDRDEAVRADTSVEALAKLKHSFAEMGALGYDVMAKNRYPQVERIEHVHTAGNSSGIVDGASLLLMGSEAAGRTLGFSPRARVVSVAVTGTEPTIMLSAPAPVSRMALAKAGLQVKDIDLFEVNEAFGTVVLRFIAEMGVSADRVNVNGGSIAMGHPLGATGAMLVGTLLDELERRNLCRGLVTLCAADGMGVATIIERI